MPDSTNEPPKPAYETTADVERYFETKQVTLSSTATATSVIELHGGEAVIIKAHNNNSGNVYIGQRGVTSSTGFELGPGESIKLEYLPDKAAGEYLWIYAIPASANDKLSIIRVP